MCIFSHLLYVILWQHECTSGSKYSIKKPKQPVALRVILPTQHDIYSFLHLCATRVTAIFYIYWDCKTLPLCPQGSVFTSVLLLLRQMHMQFCLLSEECDADFLTTSRCSRGALLYEPGSVWTLVSLFIHV